MAANTPTSKRTLEKAEISPNPPEGKQQKCDTDINSILEKLNLTVGGLSNEVKELTKSNTNLNQTVSVLQTSVNELKAKVDNSQKSLSVEIATIGGFTDKIDKLEKENRMLKHALINIQEKVADLEFHQKRNNLIFEGFPEHKNESDIDLFNRLMECLSASIDTTGIRVARCHRLGVKRVGYNRPIIANFPWYGDVTAILNSKMHLPKRIYVKTDIPKVWDERMRLMRPMFKEIQSVTSDKSTVKLTKGKLIVNKKVYLPENIEDLKKEYPDANPCKKEDDERVVFFGPMSGFSNM